MFWLCKISVKIGFCTLKGFQNNFEGNFGLMNRFFNSLGSTKFQENIGQVFGCMEGKKRESE